MVRSASPEGYSLLHLLGKVQSATSARQRTFTLMESRENLKPLSSELQSHCDDHIHEPDAIESAEP